MAHLSSVYPFHTDQGHGHRGVYIGVNITAGMGGFWFDPFEAYAAGQLTNPNCLVIGEIGSGKSALVKAFISRSLAVYGRRRFVTVLDPKGEYGDFAEAHGLPVIRLHPGGADRLNPMDPTPGGDPSDVHARQGLAGALIAGVLGRPLDPMEDAILGWTIAILARRGEPFTLRDIANHISDPPSDLVHLARRTPLELSQAAAPVAFALDKLINRTLAGMFDGPTTAQLDWTDGPGFVIDLSAVYNDREAFPLVMLAATAWLSAALHRRTDRRSIQVVDEAWAAVRHGAKHFQASLKLSRAYGISTWLICHRTSDLTAQADDGTADAKIAEGLVSDLQTRVLFRQPADQLLRSRDLLTLTDTTQAQLTRLVRGRCLWSGPLGNAIVAVQLSSPRRRP